MNQTERIEMKLEASKNIAKQFTASSRAAAICGSSSHDERFVKTEQQRRPNHNIKF